MTWWQRLLNWLGASSPGGRKEQIETWVTNHTDEFALFTAQQDERRAAKGHFFQRLRGWGKPADNDDNPEKKFSGLPAWADISIDVWEAPSEGGSEKGYTVNIWMTDIDTKEWVLRIDSKNGSLGWFDAAPLPIV